jgi:hypothetical protein
VAADRGIRNLGRYATGAQTLLVAALCHCTAAEAALTIKVAGAPSTVRFGTTQRVVYTATLTAGAQDELFRLGFRTPRFDGVPGSVEGSPISFADQTLEVSGATLLGPASMQEGVTACAPDVGPHGTDLTQRAWDVRVAAGQTATATLPFEIQRAWAPWPDTSYGITVFADQKTLGPSTLTAPIVVHADGPRIVGRHGVRIRLASTPRSGILTVHSPVVGVRRPITVRGSTSPVLRDERLRVTVGHPGHRKRSIAVRTDRAGRFVLRGLRLGHAGTWEIGARYISHRASLASDYACPLGFVAR